MCLAVVRQVALPLGAEQRVAVPAHARLSFERHVVQLRRADPHVLIAQWVGPDPLDEVASHLRGGVEESRHCEVLRIVAPRVSDRLADLDEPDRRDERDGEREARQDQPVKVARLRVESRR